MCDMLLCTTNTLPMQACHEHSANLSAPTCGTNSSPNGSTCGVMSGEPVTLYIPVVMRATLPKFPGASHASRVQSCSSSIRSGGKRSTPSVSPTSRAGDGLHPSSYQENVFCTSQSLNTAYFDKQPPASPLQLMTKMEAPTELEQKQAPAKDERPLSSSRGTQDQVFVHSIGVQVQQYVLPSVSRHGECRGNASIGRQQNRCLEMGGDSLETVSSTGPEWMGGVRALRDSHVRLVLRQLRHIEKLNRALDGPVR